MKRATKRKPAPAEPLPPPPIPMNLDEPAGPAISPWTQRFHEATAQMSPEKTEVVRLGIEATLANDCCESIWKCRRECHVQARAIEKEMHHKRGDGRTWSRRRAPKRSWQNGLQTNRKWLRCVQGATIMVTNGGWPFTITIMPGISGPSQKWRASSACCVTLAVSGSVCLRQSYLRPVVVFSCDLKCCEFCQSANRPSPHSYKSGVELLKSRFFSSTPLHTCGWVE